MLLELGVGASTAVISCAYSGDTLAHMVEFWRDPQFDKLLRRQPWASR